MYLVSDASLEDGVDHSPPTLGDHTEAKATPIVGQLHGDNLLVQHVHGGGGGGRDVAWGGRDLQVGKNRCDTVNSGP